MGIAGDFIAQHSRSVELISIFYNIVVPMYYMLKNKIMISSHIYYFSYYYNNIHTHNLNAYLPISYIIVLCISF
jgi:hypothetical protein